MLGSDLEAGKTIEDLLATMDANQVDMGVIAAGLDADETPSLLDQAGAHPTRLRVALTVDRTDRPVRQCMLLRAYAAHPPSRWYGSHRSSTSTRSTTSSTTRSTPPPRSSTCPSPSTSASQVPRCARNASTPNA